MSWYAVEDRYRVGPFDQEEDAERFVAEYRVCKDCWTLVHEDAGKDCHWSFGLDTACGFEWFFKVFEEGEGFWGDTYEPPEWFIDKLMSDDPDEWDPKDWEAKSDE